MKRYFPQMFLMVVLASFLFQGYQCGSPEFTGAKVHMQQKNYKEAIRLLEIEVQKNPQNEEAWFFLGSLKSDEGDYEGMNVAFAEALKLSNKHANEIRLTRYNHWGRHLNTGVNYLERAGSDSVEYYEKSITEFKDAIAAWPDTALTYKYLGYAYNNKGDYANALDLFLKSWEMGKDLEAAKRAGRIYLLRGDEHKQRFEGENAGKIEKWKDIEEVKKTSKKDDVKRYLGEPDQVKKGSKGTKKEEWTYNAFRLTVMVDGDKVTDKKFAAPYNPQIDSTEFRDAQQEYAKAINLLEKVDESGTRDSELLNMLLKAYVEANRIAHAIKAFEQAVASEPTNKSNHYILGVLYRTDGQYEKSVAEFKEANRLDPNDTDVLFDLGATYYNWGVDIIKAADKNGDQTDAYKPKFEAALPYMEKVAEKRKDDAQVWETMGTIYARLGQQDKAMKAFDQADWLRKNMLKLGMSEADIRSVWGEPNEKTESVYEDTQSVRWVYKEKSTILYFADGKLKGWTRDIK